MKRTRKIIVFAISLAMAATTAVLLKGNVDYADPTVVELVMRISQMVFFGVM